MDVYILLFLAFAGVRVEGACDWSLLFQCIDLLITPFNLSPEAQSTFCDYNLTDVENNCAIPLLTGCNTTTFYMLHWQSLWSAYDYVCSPEGRKLNPELYDCYTTVPAVQTAINICLTKIEQDQLDANSNCSTIEDDYECICDAYRDHCTSKPSAQEYACELSRQYFMPINQIDFNRCQPLSSGVRIGAPVLVLGAAALMFVTGRLI